MPIKIGLKYVDDAYRASRAADGAVRQAVSGRGRSAAAAVGGFARRRSMSPVEKAFVDSRRTIAMKAAATTTRQRAIGGGVVAGAALYGMHAPGSARSRSNQNSRVLKRIRAHQAAQFNGLEGLASMATGGMSPRSSGGYTL